MEYTQMNVKLEPAWVDELEQLAEAHGWSKARAIRVAIRTLAEVMSKHEEALRHPDDVTRPAEDDIRDLYMAVAREIPYDLVEVVRSLDPRYVGDQPVIRAEGWLIWRDQDTGDLIAREEAGEQRFGRIVDGKVQVMVTPAAASQN
jgi:predicted transcriptional regulator